ncbi:hypothetical protein EC973_009282 [Apophysomyces ossiformis]|uniref:SEC7 domain-containing protein n=1 Tax=Apophysomyces ossiformis TaxID=679940 RepID=A0A8H7BX67_9FUNG|nr:hypothetical protein EC973_009282 [Apophysomyces ossiformis]
MSDIRKTPACNRGQTSPCSIHDTTHSSHNRRASSPQPSPYYCSINANRPRSGSWTAAYQESKPKGFLSKFIQKRPITLDGRLRNSPSSISISKTISPTSSYRKQAPFPTETSPSFIDSHHSTPHPSLSKFNIYVHNKRKTSKTLGRFFKMLGKASNQADEEPIKGRNISTSELNRYSSDIVLLKDSRAGTICVSDDFQLEYRKSSETLKVCPLRRSVSFDSHCRPFSCITTTNVTSQTPGSINLRSCDTVPENDVTTEEAKKKKESGDDNEVINEENDEADDDVADDDECAETGEIFPDSSINLVEAQDSSIVGEKLSKRLSGGHYGSAGGLIMSTLPLLIQQSEHNDVNGPGHWSHNAPGSTSCTEVSEPESLVVVTPPTGEQEPIDLAEDPSESFPPMVKTTYTQDKSLAVVEEEENDDDPASYARRIWEEDETVYPDFDHVAEWIGNGKFCGKLHLKAETQQIDRILERFAIRYWECNPDSIFGNPESKDIIHAIVYSLLLLNTDLHVAQGERKKMSRSAFVRNTMNAIRAQCSNESFGEDCLLTDDHKTSSITFQSADRVCSHELKRTPSSRSSCSTQSCRLPALSLDLSSPYPYCFGNKMWHQEIEASLKRIVVTKSLQHMYSSIRSHQILHPASKHDSSFNQSSKHSRRRSLHVAGSRVGAFKRSVGTMIWKAARESMFMSEALELDHFGLASLPTSPKSTTSSGLHQRRRSVSSFKSSLSQGSYVPHVNSPTTHQPPISLFNHSELQTSCPSGVPYYKEGVIMRKHLLERANQRAKHREWKECFVVVDRGEVRMYRLDHGSGETNRKSMIRSSIMLSRVSLAENFLQEDSENIIGGDWLSSAQLIGEIDLKHTLSNALPSGYNRERPHAFALQQPNGGVFLFQVGSAEQVLEWVSTCNYWAARESKEPLSGGVSNMDYGWGACLEQSGPVTISEWQPPVPPMVNSAMDEASQLTALHKHVKELNEELDHHRDIKRKIEQKFPSKHGGRAMINWENKSQYLLHEIIKYQNYCDAIEKSLALQDKAAQDKEKPNSSLPL